MPSQVEVINSAALQLRRSPLFNFSLSSKELFHSDFLDWLCRSYSSEVMPIFAKYMANKPDLSSDWNVVRERGHQDLRFTFHDGSVLVVENKVKSIPNKEQLQRYSHVFQGKPKHSFLLLSLVKPPFAAPSDSMIQLGGDSRWALLDYRDLARELQSIQPIIEERDLYHGNLLFDYIKFIGWLSEIAGATALTSGTDKNFFGFLALMPSLQELRIHDLVYKRIYSDMAQFMKIRLEVSGFKVQDEGPSLRGKSGQVFVDSNFTKGTGLFSVCYVVIGDKEPGGPCVLFVQLQEKKFRLFFHIAGKKRSFTIAEILVKENLWFDFSKLESFVIKRKRKEKQFNSFNDNGYHWYRYRVIDNISPEKLAEITVQYVQQAKDNVRRIREIVGEVTK